MIGRVVTQKSTGKFIEYQSGDAPLGTLTKNAIGYGFKIDDVEEKYVDEMPEIPILPISKRMLKLKHPDGTVIEYEVL